MKSTASVLAFTLGCALMYSPGRSDDSPERPQPPASPYLEAGRKAVEAKDFKAAVGQLAKAAQEIPNDADVHNLLGYSYRHLRQFDRSLEHYRTALKLDPNHRGAHEYIGELYLAMGQLANAERQLQSLYKACPWFGRCAEHEDLKEAIEKYKARARTAP